MRKQSMPGPFSEEVRPGIEAITYRSIHACTHNVCIIPGADPGIFKRGGSLKKIVTKRKVNSFFKSPISTSVTFLITD